MYTQNLGLRETNENRFCSMMRYWGSGFKLGGNRVFYEMRNPLDFPIIESRVVSYMIAIQSLLEHEARVQVNIRDGEDWKRINNRDNVPSNTEISELAEIASNDVHKKNYLEAVLGGNENRQYNAVIEFREHYGRIIGYDVSFTCEHEEMFGVKSTRKKEKYRHNALWTPPVPKRLLVPPKQRRRS